MTTVSVTGFHLENRVGNHRKFYTVLIAENGVVVLSWGRIGTSGQGKIQKVGSDSAVSLGMRQVYAKQTRGYNAVTSDLKFTVEEGALLEGCRDGSFAHLTRAFHKARQDPKFEGHRDAVLKHYDDFVAKAQTLLNGAGDRTFDEVYAEFDQLEKAWETINDKHAEATVVIDLAKQTLSQRLMSGSL